MQDRSPRPADIQRTLLWAVIAIFAVLYGGYQVGKDLALRDNAREASGR
ncbi:hypothetical protein [Stenotrophomonas sp.]|nr:hypothetical protein [Stenotrophomonas sp.]